ncbi:hypothetical protein DL768_007160 [Monosporascus sp. mg162]|nr:hypothetical protein DL768_007160 [Monosporascus sp. mg162]
MSSTPSNDPGLGPTVMGLTWTFTSMAVIVVAFRFRVRRKVVRLVTADDWIMLIALICQLVYQACATVSYSYGLGRHVGDLSQDQFLTIMKWSWITFTPGTAVSVIARISIAILLVKLFGTKPWLKWFLIVFTVIQTMIGIAMIVTVWTQCRPVEAIWNRALAPTAKCLNPDIQLYISVTTQIAYAISDLTFVLFPTVIIWKLNMPFRRKIGLLTLMAASLFTMTAAIVKVGVCLNTPASMTDTTYNAGHIQIWTCIEQDMVIMMGCVPPLRAIMQMEFPIIRSISTALPSLINCPTEITTRSTSHSRSRNGNHSEYYDPENRSTKQLSRVTRSRSGSSHKDGSD